MQSPDAGDASYFWRCVIMAVLAMLLAFAWIPYYPVWGIQFVVASVSVIRALTVHGEDIAQF